jgi:hypothetical protein
MYRRILAPLTLVGFVAFLSVGVLAEDQKQAPEARDTVLTCIAKGAGATYFQFCPSNTGRIAQITSPSTNSHVFFNNYFLCTGTGDYEGAGFGYVAGSFAEVPGTRYQPGGAGTLPLKITVRSTDNNWQIIWQYAYNITDVELLVTAQVKKLFAPAAYAYLGIRGDFDIDGAASGNFGDSSFGSFGTSAWQRSSSVGHALTLLGHTRTPYSNYSWIQTTTGGSGCFGTSLSSPAAGDLGMSNYYYLGSVSSSLKTVKFQFQRQ